MTKQSNFLLSDSPYLQLAVDIPELSVVEDLLKKLATDPSNHLLLEIGTPLIKNEGLKQITPVFRKFFPNSYVIADLKTLDVGKLEVEISKKVGVNACVVSGLAPFATIESFIKAAHQSGIDAWVDSLGTDISSFKEKISRLSESPDTIIVHRGIDEEISGKQSPWESLTIIKSATDCLIAVAGGLALENVHLALENGADICIIGRAIYRSNDPLKTVKEFIEKIRK